MATGITVKSVWYDQEQQCDPTFLKKFEPGASYPYHNHPVGEELLMIEGSCEIEESYLVAGGYLNTSSGFKHSVKTETGCMLLLLVTEEE